MPVKDEDEPFLSDSEPLRSEPQGFARADGQMRRLPARQSSNAHKLSLLRRSIARDRSQQGFAKTNTAPPGKVGAGF